MEPSQNNSYEPAGTKGPNFLSAPKGFENSGPDDREKAPTTANEPTSTSEEVVSTENSQRWELFVIIASLFLGTFLVALDATIIGTAIPAITTTFHSLDDLGWYGSAYLLILTSLQPSFGKLFASLNTKIIYLLSVIVFEVGSILCAAAPSSTVFILGRAIQGCGAAGILQGALVIITRSVPLEKRPFYISIVISAFGLCVKIGPLLGGAFTQRANWRWCFWINVPIGAIIIAVLHVFLKLPSQPNKTAPARSVPAILRKFDIVGTVLATGSIFCLLLATQWGGQTMPSSSATVVGLFVGSGVLCILFFIVEYRLGPDAILPFHILLQRSVMSGAWYLFFFAMPTYVYGYYIPIYFQTVRGLGPVTSGVNFLALALPQIGLTVLSGWLASRFGYYTPYLIVGTLISVPGSYLLTTLQPDTQLGVWVAFFLVVAIGTGISINHPYTAVQAVLQEDEVPIGNAILQFTFSLGGALSLCIAQSVLTKQLRAYILENIPGIPIAAVTAVGAHGLSGLAGNNLELLYGLREAYNYALRYVFLFALAAGAAALLISFAFEHLNLKSVTKQRERDTD